MYVTGCRSPDVCMYVHVQPFDVLCHIHVLGIARSPDVPYLPLSVVSSQVSLFSSCLPLSVPFPHPVLIWCCKSDSSYDDVKVELKGLHSHFEDVQLEPNPAYGEVTPSQAQTEPQPYEEFVAIGGVASDGVTMEENPAYQAAVAQPYERAVGVTSSDVAMEEDPAYQSVDTTESQTEEPEYL